MTMPGCKLLRSVGVCLAGMRQAGAQVSLLSVLVCSTSAAAATQFSPERSDVVLQAEIDAIVTRKLAENPVPGGYTVAVVRDGKTIFAGAYGFSDVERRKPMRIDAVFPIASVTKTMTAFLATKLAAQGTVSLQAPIKDYLPSTVTLHEAFGSRAITLELLLLHTSGLPRDPSTRRNIALPQIEGFDPTIPDANSATVDALFRALSRDAPVSAAGERSYSNMGYDLAGHVLEIAAGRSFPDLLRSEITGPLQMNDTTVYRTQEQEKRIPTGFSYDSKRQKFWQTPTWKVRPLAGAAGVSSTVLDLARYVASMMDPEKLRMLSGSDPKVGEILLKPRVEYFQDPYSLFAQALGWRMNVFGPYGLVYQHQGDADSHHAFVAFSRLKRVGVIVLASNGAPLMDELGNALLLKELKRGSTDAAKEWQELKIREGGTERCQGVRGRGM